MDQETKKAALDGHGNKIEAREEFTARQENGTVEVIFQFDGSGMEGRTLVAFETLERDNREYAVHKDLGDAAQTIYLPKIATTIHDGDTKMCLSRADSDVTLIDTVKYENLVPGREYVLKGMLVDQKTKDAAKDAGGNPVTAQVSFTPEKKDGSVEVAFRFDGSKLAGKTLTVYEELYYNGLSIAKDVEDTKQTIYFPEITTTASDEETGLQMSDADGAVTIKDKVSYKNLLQGKKYMMRGTMRDKISGQPLTDAAGKEITAETEFTARDIEGEVEVIFRFDGNILGGKIAVVFEELLTEEKSIAVHADLNDSLQTIQFPKIETKVHNKETGINLMAAEKEITVTDTVFYQHLIPDHPYRLEGRLMDQETKEAALDAKGKEINAHTTFVPEESDGTIEVTFRFPGEGLEGRSFVAFEELYLKKSWFRKVPVAEHKDIADEAQTIHFPMIRTTAKEKEGGGKEISSQDIVNITDQIEYENLLTDKEYQVVGTVMDKKTGKALSRNGEPVTGECRFKAENPSGTVEVDFEFDSDGLGDRELVIFEKVYVAESDKAVVIHEDIDNKDQTVRLTKKPSQPETPEEPSQPETPETPPQPETPEEPQTPVVPGEPPEPESPDSPETPDLPELPDSPENPVSPRTGDYAVGWAGFCLVMLLVSGGIVVYVRRRRRNSKRFLI